MIPKVRKPILIKDLSENVIGWKKAIITTIAPSTGKEREDFGIIKLIIPKGASVVLTPTKCRASYALVEGIYQAHCMSEPEETIPVNTAQSWFSYPRVFEYRVGKYVFPNRFEKAPEQCAEGIHFFRTYKEANAYDFT